MSETKPTFLFLKPAPGLLFLPILLSVGSTSIRWVYGHTRPWASSCTAPLPSCTHCQTSSVNSWKHFSNLSIPLYPHSLDPILNHHQFLLELLQHPFPYFLCLKSFLKALLIQQIFMSVIDLDPGDRELKLRGRKIYCPMLSFVYYWDSCPQ